MTGTDMFETQPRRNPLDALPAELVPPPTPANEPPKADLRPAVQRRKRARLFWAGVLLGPWIVTAIVVLTRPSLRQFDKTGLAVTRLEATWLAAWLLVAAAVLTSWTIRRFARSAARRDAAETSYVRAQEATTEMTGDALMLPPGDPRSAPVVSAMLGAQQTALVKKDAAIVAERRSGLRGLIVGADGRVSTSKVQAALWTGALLYAFLYVLLAGWHVWTRPETPRLKALENGLEQLLQHPLQGEYVVLLGIPVAAAIAAKALVSGKILSGSMVKPPSTDEGVVAGVAETVSNDEGSGDLLDFQYAAFNVILLLYFFAEFLGKTSASPASGLPSLPPTLLALSGVSAATYLAKKSLEKGTAPQVLGATPRLAVIEQDWFLSVTGAGFVIKDATALNAVTIGGVPVSAESWTPTTVVVALPATAPAAKTLGLTSGSHPLVVTDNEGNDSAPYLIQLDVPDSQG
jgi:hypothetical protein